MALLFANHETDFVPKTIQDYKVTKQYTQRTGLCFDIENFHTFLALGLYFDAKLYLVDPLMDNKVFSGSYSMIGEPITVVKNDKGFYSETNLFVDIVKNIYSKDLSDCSYESYNDCLLNLISTDFLPGCLPPWVTFKQNFTYHKTCSDLDAANKKWSNISRDISNGYVPELLKTCKSPCTSFNYIVKKMGTRQRLIKQEILS